MKKWFASAPANIALIKYMGKTDSEHNIPTNASLSYTLNNLKSFVELEVLNDHEDCWEPLDLPGSANFSLSASGQTRFLQHLDLMKQRLGYNGNFIVRSCNNFPQGTGLASSASSFAALSVCAVRAIAELLNHKEISIDECAALSREGSGSSCRSFYQPWALWTKETVSAIQLPYSHLIHHVVLISHEAKAVGSSEAHRRVTTSPLFHQRLTNIPLRLDELLLAFTQKDWQAIYTLCWDEFMEMHQLFNTSSPPFSYMTEETHRVLAIIKQYWQKHHDGPIVTLDAGPNVHLLYRPDQKEMAQRIRADYFLGNFDVL